MWGRKGEERKGKIGFVGETILAGVGRVGWGTVGGRRSVEERGGQEGKVRKGSQVLV